MRLRSLTIFRFYKTKTLRKIWFTFLVFLIVYNEYLINVIQRFKWPNIKCKSENCVKILLVSDPQIIGETFDKRFFNPIAIIDSDRHLAKTYRQAFTHTQPDVVLFLGDLMDEGSEATYEEFDRYFRRFNDLFPTKREKKAMVIYIPGDNDIGGENGDQIRISVTDRFREMFEEKETWNYQNRISFYNINRITHDMPTVNGDHVDLEVADQIRVLISHYQLLYIASTFAEEAIKLFQPHIIFSGHQHDSLILQSKLTSMRSSKMRPLNNNKATQYNVNVFDLNTMLVNNEKLEIIVPTCSYRMGVLDIGYGYAVFDNGYLYYTVLWTPQRYYQLALYCLFTIVPLLLIFMKFVLTVLKDCLLYLLRKLCNLKKITYLPL